MPQPKKPTALKLVLGTVQPCRSAKNEPIPSTEIPSAPRHLSKEASDEWKRITPILSDMGLISQMDMVAIAMYCQSWGDHIKAENMIRKNGMTCITPNGSIQVSPWFSISKNAKLIAHKFLVEFGLTPASRSKVNATPKKDDKPEGKERFFK